MDVILWRTIKKKRDFMLTIDEEIKESKKRDWVTRESERARAEMHRKFKLGWRFVLAAPNLRILVPCDENGKPTEDGQRRIDALLEKTKV